jgi:hypothetical protein
VRRLRSNAPTGVQYVFTTGTARTPRGDLTGRTYNVSAIVEGRLVDMASFRVDVGPPARVDLTSAPTAALAAYGFPPLKPKSTPPSGARPRPIDLPKGLLKLLGFEVKAPKAITRPTVNAVLDLSAALRDSIERIVRYRDIQGVLSNDLLELKPLLEAIDENVGNLPDSHPRVAEVAKTLNKLRKAVHKRRSKIPDEQQVLREFRDSIENAFDDE